MEGATKFADDWKDNTQEEQPANSTMEKSSEETIAELVQVLDDLFEPKNIVNNLYLVKRILNENFEIPIKYIYQENSVCEKSWDLDIVNQALANTQNIVVNKKDGIVTSVMLRNNKLRRKVTIKNITKDNCEGFKRFVYSLGDLSSTIARWDFTPQLALVNIVCRDEAAALHLLELLNKQKFNEEAIEALLNDDNLYISAIENLERKTKAFVNPMNQMYPFPYNPYQMNGFFPMAPNNFGMPNYYPNMNQYYPAVPNQNFIKQPYNNFNSGMNKKPYNPNYNNNKYGGGGERKVYMKKDKNYNGYSRDNKNFKNNSKASTKSSSIEVNDNEFPPL